MLGFCAVLLCASAACIATPETPSSAENRTITDMAGRTVVVPSEIKRVICTSPPPSTFVYMVAPDRLAAWNSALGKNEYIPEKYAVGIEPIGGGGSVVVTNYELIISLNPDIVVVSCTTGDEATLASIAEQQKKLGSIPVVAVKDARNSTGYSAPIRFTGDLLGEEEQAEAMIAFYEGILATVMSGRSRSRRRTGVGLLRRRSAGSRPILRARYPNSSNSAAEKRCTRAQPGVGDD